MRLVLIFISLKLFVVKLPFLTRWNESETIETVMRNKSYFLAKGVKFKVQSRLEALFLPTAFLLSQSLLIY